jgi:hypothetical protein
MAARVSSVGSRRTPSPLASLEQIGACTALPAASTGKPRTAGRRRHACADRCGVVRATGRNDQPVQFSQRSHKGAEKASAVRLASRHVGHRCGTCPRGTDAPSDEQSSGIIPAVFVRISNACIAVSDPVRVPYAHHPHSRWSRLGILHLVGMRSAGSPSSGSRTTAGAVTIMALSWLTAAVRALTTPTRIPRRGR